MGCPFLSFLSTPLWWDCINFPGLPWPVTMNWGGLNQQKCASHSSGGQKSKTHMSQGWLLLQALRDNRFPASLLASCGYQHSLVVLSLETHLSNLSLHFHVVFSFVCVHQSPNSPLIRTPVIGLRPTIIYDLILTWLHLQRFYFQIRSNSQVLGVRIWIYLFFWAGDWGAQFNPEQGTKDIVCSKVPWRV